MDSSRPNYEHFTSADYVKALQAVKLTEHQQKMLGIHCAAPEHVITARQLGRQLGYGHQGWRSANLHYGKFGTKLAISFGDQNPNLWALVTFGHAEGSECEMTLRPQVVEALATLGIVSGDILVHAEEAEDSKNVVEGSSYTIKINAYERNPVARQKCIEHYGLSCSACGFNFESAYGSFAKNYVHVHHLVPLASIGEEYVIDPVRDLRPVCANCHAVIHLKDPILSIEDLKAVVKTDLVSAIPEAKPFRPLYGRSKGSIKILGDIISPLPNEWEADQD